MYDIMIGVFLTFISCILASLSLDGVIISMRCFTFIYFAIYFVTQDFYSVYYNHVRLKINVKVNLL